MTERVLNPMKRCADCKRSRYEGAIIRFGQGYCFDCYRTYKQRWQYKGTTKGKAK